MIARLLLCAAFAAALPRSAGAQAADSASTIRLLPAAPAKGAAAWLVVRPDSPSPGDSLVLEAEAAGEQLHFARRKTGWVALVAAPIDGPDSLIVLVRFVRGERTDTVRAAFPLSTPSLAAERLTVPPSMASFDSATTARIEGELARSRQVSARAHETRRLWRTFRVPRPGRITSVFGTPREFNGKVFSRHLGTDFAGAVGAPVTAAARGVVALVADFYLAGHAVYLDHGAGLMTGYFHLSRIDVAQGDTVAAGRLIGRVGRSGRVTGPHLHWIARYGGVTVDPMSLVRLPALP